MIGEIDSFILKLFLVVYNSNRMKTKTVLEYSGKEREAIWFLLYRGRFENPSQEFPSEEEVLP